MTGEKQPGGFQRSRHGSCGRGLFRPAPLALFQFGLASSKPALSRGSRFGL